MTCTDYKCASANCSGHGECVKGSCICNGNYTGSKCDSHTVIVIVTVDPEVPVVSIIPVGLNIEFKISIIELREITPAGNVAERVKLSSLNFSVDAGNSSWLYKAELSIGGNMQIEFSTSSQQRNLTFAGQNFTLSPNALKFAVSVGGWPFQNINNKLIIVTKAEALTSQPGCGGISDPTVKQVNESLVWTSSEYLGVTLFGRFLDNALVDNAPAPTKTTYDTLAGEYLITVPHFWNNVTVDPDFSVLVNPDKPLSTGGSVTSGCSLSVESPSSDFQTPLIATLVSVFGAAGLCVALMWIRKRRQENKLKKRLRGNKEKEEDRGSTKATSLLSKATKALSLKTYLGHSPLYKENNTSFNPLYAEH